MLIIVNLMAERKRCMCACGTRPSRYRNRKRTRKIALATVKLLPEVRSP
jgi:hypothetical protein